MFTSNFPLGHISCQGEYRDITVGLLALPLTVGETLAVRKALGMERIPPEGGLTVDGFSFSGESFVGFSGMHFKKCTFYNCRFNNSRIQDSVFENCKFIGGDLAAQFVDCHFKNVSVGGCAGNNYPPPDMEEMDVTMSKGDIHIKKIRAELASSCLEHPAEFNRRARRNASISNALIPAIPPIMIGEEIDISHEK